MKTLLRFICLFLLITIPVLLCFLVAFYFSTFPEARTVKIMELAIRISLTYVFCILGLISFIKRIKPFPHDEIEYKYLLRHAFLSQKAERFKLLFYLTFYNIGVLDFAINGLSKLLARCERYQDTSAVLFFLAKCYQKNSMPGKAINCYETLLQTDIANSPAWTNLGQLYESKGKTDKALYAFEQAITHDSGNVIAYCKLANLHYQYRHYEQAKYYSLKAYLLDAKSKDAIITSALSYANLDDEENARKFCEAYEILDSNQRLRTMVESILRVRKNLHNAP